jgi:hypothetical protein
MMVDTIATVAAWACCIYRLCNGRADRTKDPLCQRQLTLDDWSMSVAAYPQRLIMISLLTIGTAVLLELAQTFRPDRHGRISDALWKMTGGIVGVLVVHVFTSIAGP